jgi:DNA mismatch endonuclease (patch repair protein)
MTDVVSRRTRSRMMAAVRGKNTRLELRLRGELWQRGFRYRVDYGKARIDIAFPRQKVAVFLDSCFWHSCPIHGTLPKSNTDYWIPKLKANAERDTKCKKLLEEEGWVVVRIWEHELDDLDSVVSRISSALGQRGER